ncbi:MAG: TrmH family RNA methyltransferase [Armatimonadetes bacterium]|nr:TrmH family RNA methyltransferase [Armatimonadota bacterium]
MRRLTQKERFARMEATLAEAGRAGSDSGLRADFDKLPRAPIRLIVFPQGKAINQGGILRLADAFRIERVDFLTEPDGVQDFAGAMGTFDWVPHRFVSPEIAFEDSRSDGHTLIALALEQTAVAMERFEWTFPVTIVVGSELDGVPKEWIDQCETSIAIPLFGLVTSLNVATAAGIAVYDATRAYRVQNPAFTPAREASARLLQ